MGWVDGVSVESVDEGCVVVDVGSGAGIADGTIGAGKGTVSDDAQPAPKNNKPLAKKIKEYFIVRCYSR